MLRLIKKLFNKNNKLLNRFIWKYFTYNVRFSHLIDLDIIFNTVYVLYTPNNVIGRSNCLSKYILYSNNLDLMSIYYFECDLMDIFISIDYERYMSDYWWYKMYGGRYITIKHH